MPLDVFGITFPMYEIMLIFVVALTAGLIFILIELKKLNEYLKIERQDLTRLERDLGALETEEQKLYGNRRPAATPQSAQQVQQRR